MMTATLLSFKGHFCPSFTPIEKTSLFGRKNRMVQPDSLNVGLGSFAHLRNMPQLVFQDRIQWRFIREKIPEQPETMP
jgi:hypothetical protein